jgi:predicted helicase
MSKLLISQYHAEVDRIAQYGGTRKEMSVRNAFFKLLNAYCEPKHFLLIPELDFRTKFDTVVYPDGTVKDALRLDWGYWESKGQEHHLDAKIREKLAAGYPNDNILFENSQTAVLIQRGQEVMRVPMRESEKLDRLLRRFINYERPDVQDFRRAIETFKTDLPTILDTLREMIAAQGQTNATFRQARDKLLTLCQKTINPELTALDIREMMIQHILTEEIFLTVFNESQFHRENPIARALQAVVDSFFTGSLKRNTLASIESYYAAIRREAARIHNHHEKQQFLKVVYENFYKSYNPKAADRLGVVFTPNEIVRFMIESADHLVYTHFGRLLADPQVEILDPAAGTGTFITELIEYLPHDKLAYKYAREIHCNEVNILSYYIANLNIEYTYKQKMGEYAEFEHICFVDTLDNLGFGYSGQQQEMFGFVEENIARIKEQNRRTISVIIGNPPYNANQKNENENNKNREYPEIDRLIKQTYIEHSTAQKTKLYDMYVRFFRWASVLSSCN